MFFGRELITTIVPLIVIIDTQFMKILSFEMVQRFEHNQSEVEEVLSLQNRLPLEAKIEEGELGEEV